MDPDGMLNGWTTKALRRMAASTATATMTAHSRMTRVAERDFGLAGPPGPPPGSPRRSGQRELAGTLRKTDHAGCKEPTTMGKVHASGGPEGLGLRM